MIIRIKLTLTDYRNWNMEYFYSGLRGRLLVIIAVILVLATGYYALFAGQEVFARNPQIIFVMALGMLFLVMMPVSIYLQSKKVFLSDKLLQEEQEYDFREDGFSVKASFGNSEITWDKVDSIKISRSFISIYLSQIRAFVIPSGLLPAGQKEELVKLLNEKAKAARKSAS
jgi:hypothetical protein